MKDSLTAASWPDTGEKLRKCHIGYLKALDTPVEEWQAAFENLLASIEEERKTHPFFAEEISELTEATGFDFDFRDILEEYFDCLEEKMLWEKVIASAQVLVDKFQWKSCKPSEYKYRIGNSLQQLKRYDEAEKFGLEWLDQYPDDYYAAASNTFLLISLGKLDEAKAITEKYLRNELICDNVGDTFFMAAYELYSKTEDPYAKQRVQKKIAEYIAMEARTK